MSWKALLIQPPDGRACEIPYATLPAITAALRNNGYYVIPKDLNVGTLLKFLKTETADEIFNRVQKKLDNICDTRFANILKQEVRNFKKIMPFLRTAYFSFIAESKKGRFKFKTHKLLNKIYLIYLHMINLLSTNINQEDYFSRVDDKKNNAYYYIFDEFIKDMDWNEIILVGITVAGYIHALPALTLASMIRKRYPSIHIVLGGHLFTNIDFNDKEDIQDLKKILTKYAHSIVMYEGETAIVRIMDCLTNKKDDWDKIPNLIRLKNNKLAINKPFYFEKVDNIPSYDFEGFPVQFYSGLPVEISRGCYWGRCSFCKHNKIRYDTKDFSHDVPFYRSFDPEKIVAILRNFKKKYNKKYFEFICLVVSPIEIKKLCKAIINSGLDIRWNIFVRLEKSFKPELFELMAKAGAYYFNFFPETFCERTAKLHNKNYDIKHIKNLIQYWSKNRHRLPPLMVTVFSGFPGETFQDFLETYNFLIENSLITLSYFNTAIPLFHLMKHSSIYYNPNKYGIKIERKKNKSEIFNHFKIIFKDNNIAKERKKIENFILRHNKKINRNDWDTKWKILYDC